MSDSATEVFSWQVMPFGTLGQSQVYAALGAICLPQAEIEAEEDLAWGRHKTFSNMGDLLDELKTQ